MNKEFTYKGFVCESKKGSYRLVVKDPRYDNWFRTIPVDGRPNDLSQINNFTANIVAVKFFDGTEQVSMVDAVESNFEDIFISINSSGYIHVETENGIFDIIKHSVKDTIKMWEFVEEFFETENGKKRFEEYSNRDIWNKD